MDFRSSGFYFSSGGFADSKKVALQEIG